MTHKTEFMTADFVILKVAQKLKFTSFFSKERKFFCLSKILVTQTSNSAICLGIYSGICCMSMQIARVVIKCLKDIT